MRNGFARSVVAAELSLITAKGAGRFCRGAVLSVPLPGGCCDLFILFLSCRNCCSLVLQSSGEALELTGYKKWWPSCSAEHSVGAALHPGVQSICGERGCHRGSSADDASSLWGALG